MPETMPLLEILAILFAGFGAGFINVIVGSGTLITFPLLLLFGYPALTANMSSSIGLVFGNFSGVLGYRREITQIKDVVKTLLPASFLGGIGGAVLLLLLPASVFDFVVPILVALGVLLVAIGPAIQKRTAQKITEQRGASQAAMPRPIFTFLVVFLLGIYGGYFGAAQGVIMVGALGLLMTISLQNLNAMKNMLVSVVNLLSALIFTIFAFAQVDWWVVLLIATGATFGGFTGAKVGRKMPATLLRGVIIAVGTLALINMLA